MIHETLLREGSLSEEDLSLYYAKQEQYESESDNLRHSLTGASRIFFDDPSSPMFYHIGLQGKGGEVFNGALYIANRPEYLPKGTDLCEDAGDALCMFKSLLNLRVGELMTEENEAEIRKRYPDTVLGED